MTSTPSKHLDEPLLRAQQQRRQRTDNVELTKSNLASNIRNGAPSEAGRAAAAAVLQRRRRGKNVQQQKHHNNSDDYDDKRAGTALLGSLNRNDSPSEQLIKVPTPSAIPPPPSSIQEQQLKLATAHNLAANHERGTAELGGNKQLRVNEEKSKQSGLQLMQQLKLLQQNREEH